MDIGFYILELPVDAVTKDYELFLFALAVIPEVSRTGGKRFFSS